MNYRDALGGPKTSAGEAIVNEREVANNAPKIGESAVYMWTKKCKPNYMSRCDNKVSACSILSESYDRLCIYNNHPSRCSTESFLCPRSARYAII
jgi:hypothetical protein